MTGLEKILKAIETDALTNAEAVIMKAKLEAEEITAVAKIEAEKKRMEIALKSNADVKAVLNRAESAAALQEKKLILDAKQHIIINIINDARKSLAKLPNAEYTEILLQMIAKHAHNKPGIILFPVADKKRLQGDFDNLLLKALQEKDQASLTVSEETVTIEDGFILKYGDVEENCSFTALFAAAKEELQDKVNNLLFGTVDVTQLDAFKV